MATKTRRRRIRRGRDQIRAIIAEFEQSGLSRADFARTRGINSTVLRRWIRREQEEEIGSPSEAENRVAAVRVVEEETPSRIDTGVELRLPGGITLQVCRGFDEETLLSVVSVLGSQC